MVDRSAQCDRPKYLLRADVAPAHPCMLDQLAVAVASHRLKSELVALERQRHVTQARALADHAEVNAVETAT